MEIVSFDLFKQHVRADDFSADDDLLRHYMKAAEQTVIGRLNRTAEELAEKFGGQIPLQIQQAVMLLGGHWYNQREAVSMSQMYEVPLGIESLVKPFIKLSQR